MAEVAATRGVPVEQAANSKQQDAQDPEQQTGIVLRKQTKGGLTYGNPNQHRN
jgi:hypothetical protein